MMSLARAKEYILTGDRIPADEAYRPAWSTTWCRPKNCCPARSPWPTVSPRSPQAVQETKRALNLHIQRAAYAVLDVAMTAESESFLTDEHQARVQAFLDRSNKGSTKA